MNTCDEAHCLAENERLGPSRDAIVSDLVERVAIASAMATNGGDWNTYYTDDQKHLWRVRAVAAIEAIKQTHIIISQEEYRQINN